MKNLTTGVSLAQQLRGVCTNHTHTNPPRPSAESEWICDVLSTNNVSSSKCLALTADFKHHIFSPGICRPHLVTSGTARRLELRLKYASPYRDLKEEGPSEVVSGVIVHFAHVHTKPIGAGKGRVCSFPSLDQKECQIQALSDDGASSTFYNAGKEWRV